MAQGLPSLLLGSSSPRAWGCPPVIRNLEQGIQPTVGPESVVAFPHRLEFRHQNWFWVGVLGSASP